MKSGSGQLFLPSQECWESSDILTQRSRLTRQDGQMSIASHSQSDRMSGCLLLS